MRYELSDNEWRAILVMLPNKPRGVARVDDRRVLKQTRCAEGFLARTDAGSQTAHAGNGRARQQNGSDRMGFTCQAGDIQGAGRSQGVMLADLRSSEM